MKKNLLALLLFLAFLILVFILKLTSPPKKTAEIFLEQDSPPATLYHLACPYSGAVYLSDKSQVEKKTKANALTVSHHLLAKNLINQAMEATTQDYSTIILIGPNHFDLGKGVVQTSTEDWQTKFGWLKTQKQLVNQLADYHLATINPENFNTEHSICSLVSFVRKQFPQANLIPLILKSTTPREQSQNLGQFLGQNCADCLLIASLDFSHEVPLNQAQINDQKSIEVLTHLDQENIGQISCDSLPTLQVLFAYLENKGVKQGKLLNQSDSYQISGENPTSVTSYITFLY
jgi:AmmeMemoRadiSam system protein B